MATGGELASCTASLSRATATTCSHRRLKGRRRVGLLTGRGDSGMGVEQEKRCGEPKKKRCGESTFPFGMLRKLEKREANRSA